MQVKESYDLIVIGDQLSGLFLAAGAAQAGLRVLVLEESSTGPVSFAAPSGRFLGDFLAEPLIGLSPGSAVDSFLRSLGLYQNLDELFPFHEPALQLVGKGFRVDFSYEPGALKKAFAREGAPGDARAASLSRLLAGEAGEKGSFSRAVNNADLEVAAERFGWLQSALYGSVADPNISYAAYRTVLSLARQGVRYPLGGRAALRERLQSRVQVYGGTIRRRTHVDEIVFEQGKLAGVLLSSYEGFVRSSLVVGAMGARTFLHLLPEEFRSATLAAAVGRIRPRFWRFSFTLLLPEASVPEGMGSHVALLGEGDEEFLQLQVFPREAYGGIPPGHRALVVRSLVPFQPETLGEKAVGRHLRRALVRLREVLPFLDEREFLLAPDPARLAEDPVYKRYYRFQDLDFIPPSYLTYEGTLDYGPTPSRYLDWSRYGLPGLGLCSRDIYPLTGITGEILAARDLLGLLQQLLKRSSA